MKQSLLLLALALAASCGDKESDDTGISAGTPDLLGRYQVFVDYVTGCGDDPALVQDWAEGPLLVGGEGSQLTFDFYDEGMSFPGQVDSSWSYSFSGLTTWGDASYQVQHYGDAAESDGVTVLEGVFEIEVDDDEFDSNNCIIKSGIRATEVVGSD